MKLKNFKISSQLIIGFGAMMLFTLVLGVVSFQQANRIHQHSETMYHHPLQTSTSIGIIQIDILKMRLGTRDLMLAKTEEEKHAAIQSIDMAKADVLIQIENLKICYLGPKSDIEDLQLAFAVWVAAREENTKLASGGEIEKVKKSILPDGYVGQLRDKMLNEIDVIDQFAKHKADFLYLSSVKTSNSLHRQLLFIVLGILLLSFIISTFLWRQIRRPILELSNATKRFHDGDLNARSEVDSNNEFGQLSDSFNVMVESIQISEELDRKTRSLSEIMLIEEDPKQFFKTILPAFAAHTNSQMAAVYLLSDDKKRYEHFESFGMVDMARQSFAVDNFEGEFGVVLSTRKIQVIKRIPKDTRYVFHTVSGKLVPREIISIPVFSGSEIIAIISLASVRTYSEYASQLMENILETLSARIEGIIAYQKVQQFTHKLEMQNTELEAQQVEMAAQTIELAEQNRELEIQKNQLSEANLLKTNFLSNMSHELRTPLNSVIALTGVLNRRLANKIGADEYSYLEVIERNGKHLLTLINDILDISRIEAGKEEVEITKFSTEDLIADLIKMIKPQADLKKIELVQPANSNNAFVTSDLRKCRHILQNVIGNAVKFTDKGKVEVNVLQQANQIQISVTDTGIGISTEHLSHIFDQFRQADGSTSRRYGGTGLGLAIAKKYANLLGGNITVESKPNEGSTFIITLPLFYKEDGRIVEVVETYSKFSVPTQAVSAEKTNQLKTILLVDDSEPAIIQMKDFLEESGYKTAVAHNGEEAFQKMNEITPDAIILDLMMPEIDGFEVLKTIRDDESTMHIPVLILTAKQITKDDLKVLKNNHIHQLIQKGDVNKNELLQAVSSMFPVADEPVKTSITPLQKIKGKPVVLVVEDNPDNMTTVKALLGEKYTVIDAVDGQQGIELASEHVPNLIFMDIALPGIDGIKTFKTIRQNALLCNIPIIALTASAMTTDREIILSYGFDAYIAKPIDDVAFFETLNKVLYGK